MLGQHPRLRWSRRRRSILMEKYKRAFMRHHKIIYEKREKRSIPDYWQNLKDDFPLVTKRQSIRDLFLNRPKRGLKGSSSSSRTIGLGHKSSGGSLNLRRGNKKVQYEDEFEQKKQKHKYRVPCEPLSSEPYINIEIIKHGRDPNVSFSSGTVVKIACGKGYGSNLASNKTAKCVRGKWRPTVPKCIIRK